MQDVLNVYVITTSCNELSKVTEKIIQPFGILIRKPKTLLVLQHGRARTMKQVVSESSPIDRKYIQSSTDSYVCIVSAHKQDQ